MRFQQGTDPGFPLATGARPQSSRGRPHDVYDAAEVAAFYMSKEQASPRARPGSSPPPSKS
ncbi:MAG TPA: hypothetical protein VFV66_16745 [Nonomuraea sp.]|nr:hypothetical protein [Nonomuraea sp.]